MQSELFRSFDDDMFAGGIPTNHMVILGAFKKTSGIKLIHDEIENKQTDG